MKRSPKSFSIYSIASMPCGQLGHVVPVISSSTTRFTGSKVRSFTLLFTTSEYVSSCTSMVKSFTSPTVSGSGLLNEKLTMSFFFSASPVCDTASIVLPSASLRVSDTLENVSMSELATSIPSIVTSLLFTTL